jgi:trk system potassium uptake protein TrkH
MSTTGLATISIADGYTRLGQAVVLLLIQLGGIGYMTLGSFLVLARRDDLSRLRDKVGRSVFSLPDGRPVAKFVRDVMLFSLLIEGVGALALWPLLRDAGVEDALWQATFHSVSSFCTAGFSLWNDSLERFAGHFGVNAVVTALSLLGAVGFIVLADVARVLRGASRAITLTSKVILATTAALAIGGTLILAAIEPRFAALPAHERLLAASFQCITAFTTVGFDTVAIGSLGKASVLLLMVLMVIGASPSGTGGGLKSTTFSVLWGVLRSALRGDTTVRFWHRDVPLARVWLAFASIGCYGSALFAGTFLLELTESAPFEHSLFESISALSTVGLSLGLTPALSVLGKVIVIALMFVGRVGPLTFGAALFAPHPDADAAGDAEAHESPRQEDLAV